MDSSCVAAITASCTHLSMNAAFSACVILRVSHADGSRIILARIYRAGARACVCRYLVGSFWVFLQYQRGRLYHPFIESGICSFQVFSGTGCFSPPAFVDHSGDFCDFIVDS